MSPRFEAKGPLPGAAFGSTVRLRDGEQGAAAVVAAAEAAPDELAALLAEAKGLLLVQGLNDIADDPQLLIRFSRLFGPEVEDYRHNLTDLKAVHVSVPEILLVSNMPPVSKAPPKRPEPPLAADGLIPVQYPHRKGWHTDQSYRRPPPDISLFYAVTPATPDTGQTLFANGILAYEALPPHLKAKIEGLQGLHAQPGSGRGREAALTGRPPRAFAPHERSQPQPVVRTHPVTGERSLYLCEWGQMDWFEGPFVGMEPGPHGAGAALLDEIMAHLTERRFCYAHEWTQGDVLIWDNRCLIHAATWFDGETEQRLMWRTTVHGNPGAPYAGEAKSWIPAA
ncbi:MAG: TauD/TfdA family dioxygenase [Alphaproteobacteria bacterium]|nr:TauD/TfdA family dioxygenase [Alphaproteobacteria bacterium]